MSIEAEIEDLSLSPFSLSGQTAVVTGGASGIGRATSRLFAASGANVVIGDIDLDGAKSVVAEIEQAGGKALAVSCDISDEPQVLNLFDEATRHFGDVTVLAAVAAYRRKHATMTMSPDEWDRQHNIITRGTFLCMRAAIAKMKASGKGGSIVNVSSVSSVRPVVFNSMDYDSAKAGVNAMTRAAAAEFAADGIRVNAILPGGTASEGAAKMSLKQNEIAIPIYGPIMQPGRMLMGRTAYPIEQARAILFLASPASSYITGQMLAVEGGALLS